MCIFQAEDETSPVFVPKNKGPHENANYIVTKFVVSVFCQITRARENPGRGPAQKSSFIVAHDMLVFTPALHMVLIVNTISGEGT